MCTTCGCSATDEITIKKPGETDSIVKKIEIENHLGHHDHSHDHDHSHHQHDHHHHEKTIIEIEQDILQSNQLLAERNRGYFLGKNIFAINLVSSPGSGKTSLLEKTLSDLKSEIDFYVIEGDQQTMNDADRIDLLKIPVVQVNTGKACHLDSDMVNNAVLKLKPAANSIVMIENVGNLVCPSMFDLGENSRVVIISTTEGDDKPIKYPDMFAGSNVCIINKIDLLPYVNFDVEKAKAYAKQVNPDLEFFEVSATTGEGIDQWYNWLKSKIS
ncbi:MAG: hydrogenase nickel incorporation protein HypB [Bacteroidota bacterium]